MESLAFKFTGLSYAYPKAKSNAVCNVNLSVQVGESFALLGPNGSGKTTLIRLLCGRLRPQSGTFELAKELCAPDGSLDLSHCGILLENPGIYPKLSIAEYLNFFAGFYNVQNACENIRFLKSRLELPPLSTPMGNLSQGTRQKVQIARALVHRPRLLLLDEPVANLDPGAREAVWELLVDWKKQVGGTLLVSSHILSEMESFATSFAILHQGKILLAEKMSALSTDECVLRVRLPKDFAISGLGKELPPGTEILSAKKGRKSLDEVYREAVQKFEGGCIS